jgi:hypothetical protein
MERIGAVPSALPSKVQRDVLRYKITAPGPGMSEYRRYSFFGAGGFESAGGGVDGVDVSVEVFSFFGLAGAGAALDFL